MADARPPLAAVFSTFEVAATITPKDGAPITAEWVRVDPDNILLGRVRIRTAFLIGAGEVGEQRPNFAIRKDHVPTLPINSRVVAAEMTGGTVKTWNIDAVDDLDPEVYFVDAHAIA